MSDLQKQVQEIADKLLGSCEPTPDEVYDTEGFAELLDERVGCCETCGWWVEADELNDDWVCGDCV